MSLIFPLIYIIFFTESLMIYTKRKFEINLPLTFMISALMLYISQFVFKSFYIGFIICILFSLIFPYKIIKEKNNINDIKEKYVTKGLICFLFLYLFIFIYDFNRFFTRWDELSHWGKMVKEMFKLDSFYSINSSNLLVHKDYPPIMSLLELFYCFLCGKFKEVYLIRCMHLFEISLVLPFLVSEKRNIKLNVIYSFLSFIIIYMITFLFDSAIVINSIYTDYVLSFLVAYIIYFIYKQNELNNFYLFNILISLSFLLLLKQISLVFYLMSIFIFIISLIIKKYKVNLKKIILIVFSFIIPIILYIIWNNYISSLNIKGQFNISDINISNLISGNLEKWQNETVHNFIKAFFTKGLLNSHLPISYFYFLFIFSVSLFIIFKNKITKNDINLFITLFLGYIGYAILMLLLYVFCFGEYEGPILASYDRYMCTYLLICAYIIIYIIYSKINIISLKKYLIILFLISIMIIPSSYLRLRPDLIILNNHKYDPYINASKLIDKYAKNMDKVYIIDQVECDGAMYYINYFSNKVSLNNINYTLVTNQDDIKGKFYTYYYNYMKDFDYLYIYSLDKYFKEDYNFLNDDIKENTLYKINIKNNKMKLIKLKSL